VYLLDILR